MPTKKKENKCEHCGSIVPSEQEIRDEEYRQKVRELEQAYDEFEEECQVQSDKAMAPINKVLERERAKLEKEYRRKEDALWRQFDRDENKVYTAQNKKMNDYHKKVYTPALTKLNEEYERG